MLVAVAAMALRGDDALSRLAPAAAYLASFALLAVPRRRVPERWLLAAQAPLLIAAALIATWKPERAGALVEFVALATLFATAGVCHGALARHRRGLRRRGPLHGAAGLGLALGTAFAVLAAVLIEDGAILLAILCAPAALLRTKTDRTDEKHAGEFKLAASSVLREISFPLASLSLVLMLAPRLDDEGAATALLLLALIVVFAVVYAVLSAGRPLRFSLCIAALALFGMQLGAGAAAQIDSVGSIYSATRDTRRGDALRPAAGPDRPRRDDTFDPARRRLDR